MAKGKSVGRLEAFLGLDASEFYASLGMAQSSLKSAANSMKAAGKAMSTFVTLPLLAVGAASIKVAMDFETSFARMVGLAGVPTESIAGFKKEVMALSVEMGRPPQELANALYFITSSGYEGAAALDVLRSSAMAARAGLGETQVVADLLTSVVNAYGHANITAADAVDTLTAAVRLGKAEPDLMASSLGFVVPIAAEMGVEFNEVAAAVAAMSRKMSASDVSTAVTNLRQVLADLLSPAQQSREALEAWGTSATEMRKVIKEKGVLTALEFVNSKMGENEEAFSTLFGNVRSLTGALSLAGVSAEGVAEIFEDLKDNTVEIARAVAIAAGTAEDKFNRAMAELKVTAIELGTALLPIFTDFVGLVKQAAAWFTSLSGEGQKTVIMIAAFAAALGPILVILGSVVSMLAVLTPGIILAVAAVGALAASFIYLYENWEAVVERVSDWSWWRNMLIDMVQFLIKNNPLVMMVQLGLAAWNYFQKQITEMLNGFIDKYNKIAMMSAGFIPLLGKIDDLKVSDPFAMAIDGLESLKTETKEYKHQFKSFSRSISDFASKAGQAIADMFPTGGSGGSSVADIPSMEKSAGNTAAPYRPEAIGSKGESKNGTPLRKFTQALVEVDDLMKSMLTRTFVDFGTALGDIFTGEVDAVGFFNTLLLAVADFGKQFGAALISAGVAAMAFKNLLLAPGAAIAAGIALVAASTVVRNLLKKGAGSRDKVQGMAVGGTVTQGGVFQLHRDELVSLPNGAAVTPAKYATAGGGDGGGMLSTKINLRQLIIQLDRERERMKR